ncbi:uncharacterized protein BP5553_00062 [Venustampulla echinocandica]|uniref:Aminoglycoside phosphotransferase domain-containing protein n=1 Tax=Venustampulla echinocandica TaxID=2656787 RepID=A0A370TX40_9HELO|nr:uncharacterized protein BP5553_00062 [Venustampulla echinocandica]RDL40083.1 hypothetical protein BP5553_00062 [Venustampulla echinocandica]
MTISITSNADLPKCLDTESKQVKKAMQLAHSHSGIPAKTAQGPPIQGFFSRTMIVTLQNGEEVVIQFRPEPLDMEPFKLAREAFGSFVPDIELLEDKELESDNIWVYWMTRIPGKPWFEARNRKGPKALVTINKSLGRILSKGHIKGSSDEVVDNKLRPRLELLLSSDDGQILPFKDMITDLLGKLDQLKTLPLFMSHFDLNELNVMLDENCEVSGMVDWEFSKPLPFGMGFDRIHTLAGEFSEKKFHMPDEFHESERGFWQEVFDGVPVDLRKVLDANLDVVQMAVILGTLLGTFELEEGKIVCNPVSVEALPKFLSYRIPFIRGSDPPYSK